MGDDTEREARRRTFDQVALQYDQARPGYPEALFDDVVALSRIPEGGRILEIGSGTGQATLPLARRGYRILCIELGEQLAAVARDNLRDHPLVQVHTGAFEAWPIEEGVFDLVVSASAFHWIDPQIRYAKTAQALKAGGAIATWWNNHVQTELSKDFFEAVQDVYRREAPILAQHREPPPHPDEAPTPGKDELEQSGFFGAVTVRKYLWVEHYDARRYTQLLDTYSDHRTLENTVRTRLFEGIAELIDTRFGGHIVKEYHSTLYVARRK